MKVVVTGGAGFIGANLVRQLTETHSVDQVVALDDLSTGGESNLEGVDVELLRGSILDRSLLDRAFAGADAVVHLAALASVPGSVADPLGTDLVNVTGTLEVLQAARRAGDAHVVVASSSAVYGNDPRMPKRESMRTVPLSPYGVSKLAAEAYTMAYAACFGLPVLPFRFFNVFGPLQPAGHVYAAVVPAFVDAAVSGRELTIFGDGEQTRDFVYVGTVCDVLVEAVRRRVTSEDAVNLAFGTRTSLNGLVRELEATLGHRLPVSYAAARPGDVRNSQADTERLRALFPDIVPMPLQEGLRRTVDWFRVSLPDPTESGSRA
jgi:UDP-glucose 4-epimerase